MKIATRLIKLLIVFACAVCSTAAFGQNASYTWTGKGDGTNLDSFANWTTNGTDPIASLPNGNDGSGIQEPVTWDGLTTSNLVLLKNAVAWPNQGFSTIGENFSMTPNQANDVQLQAGPGVTRSGQIGAFCITNNSPHGAFHLGTAYNNNLMLWVGRPQGPINHLWVNNSTAPFTVDGSVELQAGGAAAYTIEMQGTGNFIINNYLQTDNGGIISVQDDGPGSVTWTKTGYNVDPGTSFGSGAGIGTVGVTNSQFIIKTSGNFAAPAFPPTTISIGDNAQLIWDMGVSADTINRVIQGTALGTLVVSNGSLTLSSTGSSFPGLFALYGGTLIAGGAETPGSPSTGPLGSGATISFRGGALASSIANAFDYSARFDASAGQQYKIDTGGQSVTFSNALTSAGATFNKIGAGTLTFAGTNTYSGTTTVSGGKLVLGVQTGTGAIVVSDGNALGITEIGSTQIQPATLTAGTSGGAVLEFNNVTNIAGAPLAVTGAISTGGGTITINVNSGNFNLIGESFPLFTWGSGTPPAVVLGTVNGASGTLSTNGNSIVLTITSTPYVWTGVTSASWDKTTAGNWVQSGVGKIWQDGVLTVFDDSATTANTNITITGQLSPGSLTVNNTAVPYSIASSAGNDIQGTGGLTKVGNGTLVLSGNANAYTGPTTIKGGTLSIGAITNGGIASDIGSASSAAANLVIDGGALQYTGPAADSDHKLSIGSGSATLDASGLGAVRFVATGPITLTGGGGRSLTLTGTTVDTNTLAGNLADSASGATLLNKNGTGTWILDGTNTYSGATTIANGTLQVGDGGGSGSLGTGPIVNNSAIDFNRTNSVTVNGAISGSGSLTNDGTGTVILANNNTYAGVTTINAGTLQVGNGGVTGQVNHNANITDNGTLVFNSTGSFTMDAIISGTGNLRKTGAGLLLFQGANTYTGWTTIDAGANLQFCNGQNGLTATTSVTNNGTVFMDRQDAGVFILRANMVGSGSLVKDVHNPNAGDVTFLGTNNYTGGTTIKGGAIILGDNGSTPFGGSLTGNVTFTNSSGNDDAGRFLTFNRAEDYTFSGNIIGLTKGTNITGNTSEGNLGRVTQQGGGNLILTGNNNYGGDTLINAGQLTIGAGPGTGGSLGLGPVTVNTLLNFNRDGKLTVSGAITGGGAVVQEGAGSFVTLAASNTLSGSMTISNGTLAIVATGGEVDINGGALCAGPVGAPTNVTIAGALNWNTGTLLFGLNKSLAVSNSTITAGSVNYTSGTLSLTNQGPSLTVGDKFVLFSAPVANGHTIPITSEYATFSNGLETDGSVTVASILQPPPASLKLPLLLNGSNVVISATNNFGPGGTYTLYGTNKLAGTVAAWPVISSGSFDGTGQLFITNAVKSGPFFYYLRQP